LQIRVLPFEVRPKHDLLSPGDLLTFPHFCEISGSMINETS